MPSTSFSWAHHRGRMEIRTGHTKGPSWWADVLMLRLCDNKNLLHHAQQCKHLLSEQPEANADARCDGRAGRIRVCHFSPGVWCG
jgi:hypothetical protein